MVNSQEVEDLLTAFASLSSSTVFEAAGDVSAICSEIRPLDRHMSISAVATTVQCRPGDNLALHRAIYATAPGHALVADCGGYSNAGHWGEIMTRAAIERGIAGLVINGSVRDSQQIIDSGFPVFARGLSIRGTAKLHPGTVNSIVSICEVLVRPGDLIRADADGVAIVPREHADSVLSNALHRQSREEEVMRAIANGSRTLDIYSFDTQDIG